MQRTTNRAAILIFHADQLLVIYRNKRGREYYVLPGGGVEAGETPLDAAIREAWEETSLRLQNLTLIHTIQRQHHAEYYFLAVTDERHVQLQEPEQSRQSAHNIYRLMWISLSDFETLDLQPPEIRSLCHTTLVQHTR